MGYSGRYHAASLAAVFVALAIGILIGVGLGSDVVSGTAEDLEESLGADLDEARSEVEALEAALAEEREFSEDLVPAVVAGQLRGADVALIGFGGLDEALVGEVRSALEPAGARLKAVGVVAEPPSTGAITAAAGRDGGRDPSRGAAFERGARLAGRGLVTGGEGFNALRGAIFSRFSGAPGGIDAVVVARARPDDLSPRAAADADRLESNLLAGIASARGDEVVVVGAERSDADPSSIPFFEENGLASADNTDQLSGRVSLVFALDGAEGSYGTKETADALLPDLLRKRPGETGSGG